VNETCLDTKECSRKNGVVGGFSTNIDELILPSPVLFLPKQLRVFTLCQFADCVLYSGAFRAGKTLVLANVSIKTCIDNPGCVGLLGALVDSMARDVILGTLVQQLDLYQEAIDRMLTPRGLSYKIIEQVNRTQGKMEVRFTNGSKIYIRPCDDERKLAGRTIDFFGLDEAVDMDETIFTQLIGRKSGTGNLGHKFGLLTTNPGAENHWIYKYFFTDPQPNFEAVETTTYDNVLLPDYKSYINSLERVYDSDWINRYLDGKWGAFSGQIFKEFNLERHTGQYIAGGMKFPKYIAGVDYGMRSPTCIVVFGISDYNKMYAVEEFYQSDISARDTAKRLQDLNNKYNFDSVYIDPTAADLVTQAYNLDVPCGTMKGNTPVSLADNDVAKSISKLKSFFKKDVIFFDKTCVNTIKQFQSYRYKKDTEQPFKKDDHAVDAVRYAITDFDPFSHRSSYGYVFWRKRR